MELIEGSETSANHNRTPGKYPKEYTQYTIVKLFYVTERLKDASSATYVTGISKYLVFHPPSKYTKI